MYLAGHVGLALMVGAGLVVTGRRRAAPGVVVLVLLASAPDVDLLLASVAHRGITHTVWAAFGLGGALAVGGWLLAHRSAAPATPDTRFAFGLGTASVLTHLVGDVITPMGVRPLYPLVPTGYTLDLVAARNPEANLALLAVGLLALAVALAVERARWIPPLRARVAAGSDDRVVAPQATGLDDEPAAD